MNISKLKYFKLINFYYEINEFTRVKNLFFKIQRFINKNYWN